MRGTRARASHIAKALLLLGCARLYRCRYTTAADMLTDLMASRADRHPPKKLKTYTSPDILLIDELGFDRLEQQDARNASLFFKVIDGRYCKGSTLITTNIDFSELGDYLGDPVVTTAIVDRMVHHSIIINIEGPSWRMHESKKLNAHRKKQIKSVAAALRSSLPSSPTLRSSLHEDLNKKPKNTDQTTTTIKHWGGSLNRGLFLPNSKASNFGVGPSISLRWVHS